MSNQERSLGASKDARRGWLSQRAAESLMMGAIHRGETKKNPEKPIRSSLEVVRDLSTMLVRKVVGEPDQVSPEPQSNVEATPITEIPESDVQA